MNTLLSPYIGEGPIDWAVFEPNLRRWNPPMVVILNPNPDTVMRIHGICPDALICLRDHPLSEQFSDIYSDPANTGRRHAGEWAEKLWSWDLWDIRQWIVCLFGNEMNAKPWDGHIPAIVAYTVAHMEHGRMLDINTAGPEHGVCWPYWGDWKPYEPIRDAAIAFRQYISFHRYWRSDLGPLHEWENWAGEMPEGWEDCKWLITECGDDGLLSNRCGRESGWQDVVSPEVYLSHLEIVDRKWAKYPIVGAAVFLRGKQAPWQTYDITPIEHMIAAYAERRRNEPEEVKPVSNIQISPGLLDPCAGRISQEFGEKKVDYSAYNLIAHNGRDIAAPKGTPVIASHDGECWVYEDSGYGKTVEIWYPRIEAGALFKTIYAHLSAFRVGHKQMVKAGQVIGLVGSTGNSTGPHLHFGIKFLRGKNPGYRDWVDPRPWLTE
jgi:hypothetical protein